MDRHIAAHGGTEVGAPVAGVSVMPWLGGAAVAAAPTAAAAAGAEVFAEFADTAAAAVLGETHAEDNLSGAPYVAGTFVGVAAALHLDGTPVVHPIAAAQDSAATIAMLPAVVAEVAAAAGAAATKGAASPSVADRSASAATAGSTSGYFPCSECSKQFPRGKSWRRHVRAVYRGKRPHVCTNGDPECRDVGAEREGCRTAGERDPSE